MIDVRNLAVDHLTLGDEHILHINRIILGREYGVPEWLERGYHHIARRPAISDDTAATLGLQATLSLFRIREAFSFMHGYSRPPASPAAACTSTVDELFLTEIMDETTSLGAVDRVVLARMYGVSEWLRSAYVELVERREIVTLAEAAKLGLESTTTLCRARERAARAQLWTISDDMIRGEFEEELQAVRQAGSSYRCLEPITAEPGPSAPLPEATPQYSEKGQVRIGMPSAGAAAAKKKKKK